MNHCIECPAPPVRRGRCRRCYSRNWMRNRRANYPIRTCTACDRERPIQRQKEGWCEACVTRWQEADRPAAGPPPLNFDAVRAARAASAEQARAVAELNKAIRRGGWEWAA